MQRHEPNLGNAEQGANNKNLKPQTVINPTLYSTSAMALCAGLRAPVDSIPAARPHSAFGGFGCFGFRVHFECVCVCSTSKPPVSP